MEWRKAISCEKHAPEAAEDDGGGRGSVQQQ
jgi:hypothetical protein